MHESPNIIQLLADTLEGTPYSAFLRQWENTIFSLLIIVAISVLAWAASRRIRLVPERLQAAFEMIVGAIDDFVCGILGPSGRRYTPFIGTLFIYILAMNLSGLIPFIKSPATSWSTTLALALCVFMYVQYTALKNLGMIGYIDHLMDRPRGALAFSVIIPVMMFFLHIIAELIRPISLSLRLRSNIWGDDMLIAILARFGIAGLPLLFFNMLLTLIAAIVQAVVFCLLTTIYFSLVLTHEEA